ncbi:AraC family transcriptional regulator [Vallitalea guaymasensis]|uniref:Helix-turn-helix transcriptional regulator n=1 Tax=Vallitalea guaymasensis TaxID=1185412 RepID=A0A8J8SD27_9FIRM|nr:AraC family transcriptional regulator [Vallitalea guaymasensis]QUH30294.1 helix-turn-helix transcriptional regulator [Vallitalea guaymasensis]
MLLLEESIKIDKLYTFFYFEFAKNYVFRGERHDFWEAVYVDKGVLEVMADTRHYVLNNGQMIFHKPNEFHSLWANGEIAPNVIVFSFGCHSEAMKFFENKIIKLDVEQKSILQNFIREARRCLQDQQLKADSPFGSNQLLKLYMEQFFIHCIRNQNVQKLKESIVTKKRMEKDIAVTIEDFLKEKVNDNICLKDIVSHMSLSATYLKELFKKNYSVSIMKYYRTLRIENAKQLIRESSLTFTEIAEQMNYTSIHYFSKQFKDCVGMTPTEYAKSLVHF